jgi:hypothetical protein
VRESYERLFHLIEQKTLSEDVRYSAKSMIDARFRESEIREIEAQLGGRISPARERYRLFLSVVKQLMDKKITAEPFIEEFKLFTKDCAGRLDFGIYSFCLDSLFRSLKIPVTVKELLVLEIMVFPSLIRRELISNVLSYPAQSQDLIRFVDGVVDRQLDPEVVIEIDLLKNLKLRRFSMEAISALAINPSLSSIN